MLENNDVVKSIFLNEQDVRLFKDALYQICQISSEKNDNITSKAHSLGIIRGKADILYKILCSREDEL